MRLPGRMEPGRSAGPFTGQRVSFSPARIADTSARLSRLLRPLMDGTVIGGGLAVSFATLSDASVSIFAESIASTCTGFIATGLSGRAAGSASPSAHAVRRARAGRPGKKREIIIVLLLYEREVTSNINDGEVRIVGDRLTLEGRLFPKLSGSVRQMPIDRSPTFRP